MDYLSSGEPLTGARHIVSLQDTGNLNFAEYRSFNVSAHHRSTVSLSDFMSKDNAEQSNGVLTLPLCLGPQLSSPKMSEVVTTLVKDKSP